VNLDCLGSSDTVQTSRKLVQQSIQSLVVPDDGCRLVLGLGPTTRDLYSAGSHSYGGNNPNESAAFCARHCIITDPGLTLGLSGCMYNPQQRVTVRSIHMQEKMVSPPHSLMKDQLQAKGK
jgi:hypothetical protein